MLKMKIIISLFISFFLVQTSRADELKQELQEYINEIITEVRETKDPEEKREILNDLFENLKKSFEVAKNSPYVPEEDHRGIDILADKINERSNELNGLNGLEKVPDGQLNDFAYFTLQDIEQADTIVISLSTLLLIIILAILIF
jgi:regulator of sirC expression with transglutaminase-like and TPR domain